MIIDQLPLLSSDVQDTDELPIERGTTTYKTTKEALVKSLQDEVSDLQTDKQDTITANGILKGNGSTVSAATKGTDYGGLSFTVTLNSQLWNYNQQTVSNSNFKASGFAYVVTPQGGASSAAYAEAGIYAYDVSADGYMVFHCESVPSANITVNVLRVVSA